MYGEHSRTLGNVLTSDTAYSVYLMRFKFLTSSAFIDKKTYDIKTVLIPS
jgi:hypothetical protein